MPTPSPASSAPHAVATAPAAPRSLAGLLATGGTPAAIVGVAISVLLTLALVGIPCFAAVVGAVTVHFTARGLGVPPRLSLAPYAVAGGLYALALAVGAALAANLGGDSGRLWTVLPAVYLLMGWVAAPWLVFAVLSLDPLAPATGRERIARALYLTERVPARHRAAALVASALALFVPLAVASMSRAAAWPLLLTWAGVSIYPVLASALLVRTYLRVRPALSDDAGPLPTAPGHLRVHALLAFGIAGLALPHATPSTLALLLLSAGLAGLAAQALLRAHQLGRLGTLRPGMPPGRRAFTGRLVDLSPEGGTVEHGGVALSFAAGLKRHGTIRRGETATLVGTFSPTPEGFRVSGRRAAPADAVLYAGGLTMVLRARVRRALLLAHGALGMLAALGAATLL